MAETSRPWNGTAVGDATEAPYDAPTEFAALLEAVSNALTTTNHGGVFRWTTGQLLVTGAASPVSISIGQALVNGVWYYNSAPLSIAVPTPTPGNSRIDRIILRKDWTAQTIRVVRLAGVEGGAPVAPSLTQTGATWEIPLAQATITDAGVITLVDQREYLVIPNLHITDAMINDVAFGKITGTVDADTLGGIPAIGFPYKITETVIGVGGGTVDWVNINQNFRHLLVMIDARSMSFGGGLVMDTVQAIFNGDAGNNYEGAGWDRNPIGENWLVSSPLTKVGLAAIPPASATVGHSGGGLSWIPNYRNTNFHKSVSGPGGLYVSTEVTLFNGIGVWRSTAAINRITMETGTNVGNPGRLFAEGSVFSLYGLP